MEKRAEELICRLVDGLITPGEGKELEALMAQDPEVRLEVEAQRKLGAALRIVGPRELQDDVTDLYWSNVYHRLERRTGWVLAVAGVGLLAGYGFYQFETNPGIAGAYRIGVAAVIVGLVLVFAGVLRLRLRTRKTDKYRGVIR